MQYQQQQQQLKFGIPCKYCQRYPLVRVLYYCKDCNHKFVPLKDQVKTKKAITAKDKKLILFYKNCNVSIKDLANYFPYSVERITKFLKEQGVSTKNPYRKNPREIPEVIDKKVINKIICK